jgi:hypothetical protein
MNESEFLETKSDQQDLNPRLRNVEFQVSTLNGEFCNDFDKIISLFAPMHHLSRSIKIGSLSDGGYVICEPRSKQPRSISLGLGFEVSAEAELLSLGFEIIAADGSVENPFPDLAKFGFRKSHISSREVKDFSSNTFDEFLNLFEWDSDVELIKIDIEGAEYDLLLTCQAKLQKARILVIEFHGLELLGDAKFRKILINLLGNLHETHKPIHVHANNGAPGIKMAGGEFPTLLEVTFLKNEECTGVRNFGPFPTELDRPNTNIRPDIDLDVFFGIQPTYLQLVKLILSTIDFDTIT